MACGKGAGLEATWAILPPVEKAQHLPQYCLKSVFDDFNAIESPLRAEMNVVGIHYGLLLEAYLSAAPEHLTILMHSNTLLERCRAIRANLEVAVLMVSWDCL